MTTALRTRCGNRHRATAASWTRWRHWMKNLAVVDIYETPYQMKTISDKLKSTPFLHCWSSSLAIEYNLQISTDKSVTWLQSRDTTTYARDDCSGMHLTAACQMSWRGDAIGGISYCVVYLCVRLYPIESNSENKCRLTGQIWSRDHILRIFTLNSPSLIHLISALLVIHPNYLSHCMVGYEASFNLACLTKAVLCKLF